MSRRAFLLGGLGTAAAVSTGTYAWLRRQGYEIDPPLPVAGAPRAAVAELPGPPFDPRARAALAVVVDQLLPGEPTIGLPSGTAAGAMAFLDRACRHRGLRAVRADVLKLCRDLNLRARRQHGQSYAELPAATRDALLATVAADARSSGRYRPQRALQTTLRIALEGYLGHPQHGGNKEGTVWTALEIPMPRQVGGGHSH